MRGNNALHSSSDNAGSKTSAALGLLLAAAPNPPLVAAHNALQIVGFMMIACVLLTAVMSRRVHRSPNWYLFMALWLLWCVVYFLLVGQQDGGVGESPNPGICLLQGVMVNTTGASNSFAILSIALEVCFTIAAALKQKALKGQRYINFGVFCLPIVIFVFALIENLAIALAKPSVVVRRPSGVYCVLASKATTQMTAVLLFLPAVAVIIVELISFYLLYRYWITFRRAGTQGNNPVSVALVVRVLIFGTLPIVLLSVMIKRMSNKSVQFDDPLSIILDDCLPIAAALIFGTQQDILHVWMFWRKDPARPQTAVWEVLKYTTDQERRPAAAHSLARSPV